jgi:hypothetical protein
MNKIYHYTSFETFKKIVENKSIRFNSLKNVDDPYEAITSDFGSLQPYYFVSCWSKNENNIPLWEMYAKPDSEKLDSNFGIRFGVNSDFLTLKFNNEKERQVINHNNSDIFCYPIFRENEEILFLEEAEYRDEPNVAITTSPRGYISSDFIQKFGLVKIKEWKFQEELRFILQALPKRVVKKDCFISFIEATLNNPETKIPYIDICFDAHWVKEFDVMLSPRANSEHKKILETYIETNIPSFCGNVTENKVKIRETRKK